MTDEGMCVGEGRGGDITVTYGGGYISSAACQKTNKSNQIKLRRCAPTASGCSDFDLQCCTLGAL